MNATKYIFKKEIIIPNEDKYHLGEIILHMTNICYTVYKLYISYDYEKVGNYLINNTLFNYNSLAKLLEIKYPIECSSKYFFQLSFSFNIKNENEIDNIKKEYKVRIKKWVYDNSKYDDVKQEEVEV